MSWAGKGLRPARQHPAGERLMQYAETRALGATELFCLSTQDFNYFQQNGGFTPSTPDDLPPPRRERYDKSGRRSLAPSKSCRKRAAMVGFVGRAPRGCGSISCIAPSL
jgi:N-acetylglutamate synthase-like GNAT family acetyltransferase